jgi:ABC-type multidrug transport system fused ATPase/permease subunit
MPFILLLANPELLQTHDLLQRLYIALGASSYHEFLVLFGLFGIAILTLGNLFVAVEQWVSDRFLHRLGHRVETQVLERMMKRPYEYFVTHHSGTLSDVVLSQVERVVEGVIGTLVTIFGSVALAAFIVLMLLVISFETTLATLIGLLAAYLLVFLSLRRRMESHGAELTGLSAGVFTAVKETLDGIKEIKTRRAEAFFSRRFAASRMKMAKLIVRYNLLNYLPHFVLETVVFAGFVAVALYFVFETADTGISLAFIALYGMAVYRLIPALKGIFEGIATIHHNADAVTVVLRHCAAGAPEVTARDLPPPEKEIRLAGVTHRYPGSGGDQLSAIDLAIPAGSSVCLFGPSGSGKTTILNLLVGLIAPQRGQILCDGVPIGPETLDSWRQRIGYAPQQIYLFDDTLASNIAFGVAGEDIDMARVEAVGRIALLDEFVSGRSLQGYRTVIGEDGETLSGGQRQRVGIARALYHDPDVLVFDEAFTGLDTDNRRTILGNLFRLAGKTLVFSSHETAIAALCDRTVIISNGQVVEKQ